MTLELLLEEMEEKGNYGVALRYGGEIGLDDFGIPKEERTIHIFATPVDESREKKEWKGTLNHFREASGRTIEDVLEEIKMQFNYAVTLFYNQKEIMIFGTPVGYLGGIKQLWKGTLSQLKEMKLDGKPISISNPPKPEEIKNFGHYVWGTEDNIKKFIQ